MDTAIPIIDFGQASSSPQTVADLLLTACTEWGFFYIKNHPIPQQDIEGIFELEKRFFSQPLAQKSEAPYIPSKNAGYKPASSSGANGSFKDPREAFSINKWPTPAHVEAAVLPPVLSESRAQIDSFQRRVRAFAAQLLELITLALDLPRAQFTAKHDPAAENFDNFELMHYVPIPLGGPETGGCGVGLTTGENENEKAKASRIPPPRYRISPHTDWGTLTLLFQSSVGGLEVRPPRYTAATPALDQETWTPAPVLAGLVLVNIGDMLEFWTAGRLKSTWHRVVPTATEGRLDRYTFAYFLHPDRDAVLLPIEGLRRTGGDEWVPRYEGIGRTAEEHIHARIRGAHGVAKNEEENDGSVGAGATLNGKPKGVDV